MIAEATKVCKDCGLDLPLGEFYARYDGSGDGLRGLCKKCTVKREMEWRAKNPATDLYNRTKSNARRLGMPFDLTREWFEDQLSTGVCNLSGLKFERSWRSLWLPSTDRFINDPTVGYVQENSRIICWGLNILKGPHNEETFLKFLRQAADGINEQARTH